jgi:fluoride exporter
VWLGARLGAAFPYPTLLINVSGSLALGVPAGLLPVLPERAAPARRLLLAVGVLGGYTTFSTTRRTSWTWSGGAAAP